jgi:transcriptional regulator with XRE-family HTH domain
MKIGNNIRKIRELKNLTQQYMADAMGISQP